MKILLNIGDYGTTNDVHLSKLLKEIEVMRQVYEVDVFIDNTTQKVYSINVEQSTHPNAKYELTWKCRPRLLENISNYDLFIYIENDMLLTADHLKTFLRLNEVGKYAKFLRYEIHNNIQTLPDMMIWKPTLVGNNLMVVNLHQGLFILTQKQLKQWSWVSDITKMKYVSCKGLTYDVRESAATQPYVENNFNLTVEVSNIDSHLICHLGNNYPNYDMTVEKLLEKAVG